jgi:hypothetical protein
LTGSVTIYAKTTMLCSPDSCMVVDTLNCQIN